MLSDFSGLLKIEMEAKGYGKAHRPEKESRAYHLVSRGVGK